MLYKLPVKKGLAAKHAYDTNEALCQFWFFCSVIIEVLSIEAEFLDEIQTKVLRVFLLAIHSHLYSFALRLAISSNSRNLLQFLRFSYCTL